MFPRYFLIRTNYRPFEFDFVFSQSAEQSDVFAQIVDMVEASVDGHRALIFAYGPTGTGL